jgi:hypothetical protein
MMTTTTDKQTNKQSIAISIKIQFPQYHFKHRNVTLEKSTHIELKFCMSGFIFYVKNYHLLNSKQAPI